MDKIKIKYWVDFGMLISFLIVTLTGIVKFPNYIDNFRWLFDIISFRTMSRVHDISGAVMVLFVIVHFALNWGWVKSVTKSIFSRNGK